MLKGLCGVFALVVTLSVGSLQAAPGENVVLQWNEALWTAQAASGGGVPGISSFRAAAMVHTAMFDAWAAYDGHAFGTRLGDTLRRPSAEYNDANKAMAISYAAYHVLVDLYGTFLPGQVSPTAAQVAINLTNFNNLMASLGYPIDLVTTNPTTPTGIGNTVALALLEYRHGDGANQLADEPNTNVTANPPGGHYSDYTGYVPVNTATTLNNPSLWQPTSTAGNAQFLQPFWELVAPFALESVAQVIPKKKPFLFGSHGYNQQSEQILYVSAHLNDMRKVVAEWWYVLIVETGALIGPGKGIGGIWNDNARYISDRDVHTLDQDVQMFFILNNAMFDASILGWYNKRLYDSIRPISAIHFLYSGKNVQAWGGPGLGTQTILGQNFNPYTPTPADPDFPSGNGFIDGAAALALKKFTGSEQFGRSVVIPAGSSAIEPGITPATPVTLTWATFNVAAIQGGESRIFGGINFPHAVQQGLDIGTLVGEIVIDKCNQYISGYPVRSTP